jgi:hypothetical protein
MRYATTADMLYSRPNHWPQPPPGFTTQQVLGPGSDNYNNMLKNNKNNNSNHANNSNKNTKRIQKEPNHHNVANLHENAIGKKKKRQRTNHSSNTQKEDISQESIQRNNNNNRNNKNNRRKNAHHKKPSLIIEANSEEPSQLSTGLTSSRQGFSIEEMEIERAQKRSKLGL